MHTCKTRFAFSPGLVVVSPIRRFLKYNTKISECIYIYIYRERERERPQVKIVDSNKRVKGLRG